MKKTAMKKLLSYALCFGTITGSVTPALTTVAFAETEITTEQTLKSGAKVYGIFNREDKLKYQTVTKLEVQSSETEPYTVAVTPDFSQIKLSNLAGEDQQPLAGWVGVGIEAPKEKNFIKLSSTRNGQKLGEEENDLMGFHSDESGEAKSGYELWVNILNPSYYDPENPIKYTVTWKNENNETETDSFNVYLKAPETSEKIGIASANPVGKDASEPIYDEAEGFKVDVDSTFKGTEKIKGSNVQKVDFSIRDLKKHTPTDEKFTQEGAYVGMKLTGPEGATKLRYTAIKDNEADLTKLFGFNSEQEDKLNNKETSIFIDVLHLQDKAAVNKFHQVWMGLVWLDDQNLIKGCDYLLLNFDDVTLAEAKNAVTIDPNIVKGKVTTDKTEANKEEKVTLTAEPETGYQLKSFTVTGTDGEEVGVTLDTAKANTGTFTMPDCSVTVSAIFEETPAPTYTITVDANTVNGKVNADKTTAEKGEEVKLTAEPDKNYELEYFTVTGSDGEPVDVDTSGNTGTFKMPDGDVNVTATFKAKSSTVNPTPTPQRQPSSQTTQPTTDKTTDPDGTVTETTTYPDGTTTEKVTETDGTVTETTTKPDGSTEKTTTAKDGTVTEEKKASDGTETTTVKDPDGNTVYESTMNPDGSGTIETLSPEGNKTVIDLESDKSSTTTTTMADETVTEVKADANGNITSASANVSSKAVQNATGNAAPVELVLPAIPADHTANDVALDITLPEGTKDIEVAIPVENGNPGSVAMIEDENGELVPIKESLVDENGKLIVPLDGSKKIVIKDNSKAFSDMPGYDKTSYPGEGVAYVSARKIFNGNEDGSFNLNGNVTRGMLARVLYNLEGNPSVAGLPVPAGVAIPWYKDASAWAANKKLMAQGSDFRGEDLLTREQLAMILWREQGKPAARGDISVYDPQDVASISSPEMLEAVSWAVGEHIIGQNSPLNGQKESTRGEVANMLYRFLTKVEAESNELI